ncbi:MAG TPA: hypothetical protein VG146_23350 [Verrucomicrobiae bacterium]|nr:hypothetical protein [Verrucomicrobiae bacterium]
MPATALEPVKTRSLWTRPGVVQFLVAFAVMLSVLTLPRVPISTLGESGWSAVLNYAHQKGWQYGTDLVYTYGPAGFLTISFFAPHWAWVRLSVDVLVCFAVAAGAVRAAWRLTIVKRILLLIIFVFFAANIDPRIDLLLDAGLLFWGLLCRLESGGRLVVSLAVLVILASFAGLTKLTFLVLTGLTVTMIALDLALRRKPQLALGLMACFAGGTLSLWLLLGQDLRHMGPFVINALAVARGYNTMGLEGSEQLRLRSGLVIVLAIGMVLSRCLAAGTLTSRHSRGRAGLLLAWLLLLMFLVWKHGFLRADEYHTCFFLGFVPILAVAFELLPCEDRTIGILSRGIAGLCALLAGFTLESTFIAGTFTDALVRPSQAAAANLRSLCGPGAYHRQMMQALAKERLAARLPKVRNLVGQAPIDVFGYDEAYAWLNDLNYSPRPVFQSYAAYSAPLMRLNEQFYLSARAPEYVLFGLRSLDRRFPPLEDARVLRALLINYQPVTEEGPFLLLKSRSSSRPSMTLLREGTVGPGEPIGLEDFPATDLWIEIHPAPTWRGRLRELFYREPKVRLAVWGDLPGRLHKFRAPVAMLEAGFLASPLLLDNQQVLALFKGQPAHRPTAYSIELSGGSRGLWQGVIRYRVFKINSPLGQCAAKPQ